MSEPMKMTAEELIEKAPSMDAKEFAIAALPVLMDQDNRIAALEADLEEEINERLKAWDTIELSRKLRKQAEADKQKLEQENERVARELKHERVKAITRDGEVIELQGEIERLREALRRCSEVSIFQPGEIHPLALVRDIARQALQTEERA